MKKWLNPFACALTSSACATTQAQARSRAAGPAHGAASASTIRMRMRMRILHVAVYIAGHSFDLLASLALAWRKFRQRG